MVERHPSLKLLALSFLMLVGAMLVAEGFDQHVPKGYLYFSMAFATGVEVLNIRRRGKRSPPAEAVYWLHGEQRGGWSAASGGAQLRTRPVWRSRIQS
jgi:hypothetical protein